MEKTCFFLHTEYTSIFYFYVTLMNTIKFSLLTCFTCLPLFAHAASFNCEKAGTPIEKSICANEVLDELDSQLGQLYGELKGSLSSSKVEALTKQQHDWLKKRDTSCEAYEIDCLRDLYEQRIADLSHSSSSNSPRITSKPSTVVSTDKLSTSSKVSLRSVGPIQFGMEISKAQEVSGVEFKRENQSAHCAIITPVGKLENDINFIAVDDVIVSANIFTTQSQAFNTKSNIGMGSSETQLIKAYPNNIKLLESSQVEGNNYKVLAFVPKDSTDKDYRILFTLFENENGTFNVDHFSVGSLPEVKTGCNR